MTSPTVVSPPCVLFSGHDLFPEYDRSRSRQSSKQAAGARFPSPVLHHLFVRSPLSSHLRPPHHVDSLPWSPPTFLGGFRRRDRLQISAIIRLVTAFWVKFRPAPPSTAAPLCSSSPTVDPDWLPACLTTFGRRQGSILSGLAPHRGHFCPFARDPSFCISILFCLKLLITLLRNV